MEALWHLLEMATVMVAGLAIRLSLLLVAVAVGLAIVVPLVYGFEGFRAFWSHIALQRVAGLRWRAHTYYTPRHHWLRERAGRVRVGLDDLAAHLVGGADAVTVPIAGTRVKEGEPLLTLGTGSWKVMVPAPVSGVLSRVNPRILNRPSAMTDDPYRTGWLVEITPADQRHRGFLHDDAARTWFAGEAMKLSHSLEHATGIAAADGGELIVPVHRILDERQRDALVREFLQA